MWEMGRGRGGEDVSKDEAGFSGDEIKPVDDRRVFRRESRSTEGNGCVASDRVTIEDFESNGGFVRDLERVWTAGDWGEMGSEGIRGASWKDAGLGGIGVESMRSVS
jgi:hypothetical protein